MRDEKEKGRGKKRNTCRTIWCLSDGPDQAQKELNNYLLVVCRLPIKNNQKNDKKDVGERKRDARLKMRGRINCQNDSRKVGEKTRRGREKGKMKE